LKSIRLPRVAKALAQAQGGRFLDIKASGTIGGGVINLHYGVITPHGTNNCEFHAGILD